MHQPIKKQWVSIKLDICKIYPIVDNNIANNFFLKCCIYKIFLYFCGVIKNNKK